MKTQTIMIMIGVCASGLIAANAGETNKYGYSDTPFLPNSEWRVHDIKRPLPPKVEPGTNTSTSVPSDAIILFDGKDLSQWMDVKNRTVTNDYFDIMQTGQIKTKQVFGDCQLHLEWAVSEKPDGDAMKWGNSSVFMMGKYELQVIQSAIYADGIAGAIYGQTPPLAYPIRPAGEWNVYDITFTAPRFDGSKLVTPAYFTVRFNGILVQDHTPVLGSTRHKAVAIYDSRAEKGPIMIQHHGSHVRYRNIWIRNIGL